MHTDVHQFLYREVVGGGSTSKLSISSCTVPNDLHSLVRVSYGRVCVTTAETDTTNRAKVNTLVFSFSLESKGGQHHIRKILTTGCNSSFNTSCNLKYTSALCDLICTLLGNLLDLGDNENSYFITVLIMKIINTISTRFSRLFNSMGVRIKENIRSSEATLLFHDRKHGLCLSL